MEKHDPLLDSAPPRPAALIESLRAFGYDAQTAIADLIDNSITAQAKMSGSISSGTGGRPLSPRGMTAKVTLSFSITHFRDGGRSRISQRRGLVQ